MKTTEQKKVLMLKYADQLACGECGPVLKILVAGGLGALADNQRIVSSTVPDCIPEMGEQPSKDAVRSYVLAIIVELTEFLQELDWKPWRQGAKAIDPAKVTEEFADVLAFLGVTLVHLEAMGITSTALAEAYAMKSIKNINRLVGDYAHAAQGVKDDHLS